MLWRNGPGWEALTVAGMLFAMSVGLLLAVAWDVARVRRAPAAGHNPHYWFMFVAAIGLVAFWVEKLAPDFLRRAAPRGLLRRLSIAGSRQRCGSHDSLRPARSRVDLLGLGSPEAVAHVRRDSARGAGRRAGGRLVKQIGLVQDAVQNPFSLPALAYVAALSAVAALYFVMGEYTQSLELRPFDVMYGVAFSVVVLLLVLTCTRMVFIWIRLRSALRTIDLLPVRETFGTVPLIDSWGPILHRAIEPGYADQHTA